MRDLSAHSENMSKEAGSLSRAASKLVDKVRKIIITNKLS